MDMGPEKLAVIVLLIVLLFGAGRLPGLGRNLGEGIREFRRSMSQGDQASVEEPRSDRP